MSLRSIDAFGLLLTSDFLFMPCLSRTLSPYLQSGSKTTDGARVNHRDTAPSARHRSS